MKKRGTLKALFSLFGLMNRIAREEEEKPSIAALCKRNNYEVISRQDVYCGKPREECLYRSGDKSKNGKYRCLNIDKMGAWRYTK